ncbi:nitrate ABC transporter permease [Leptolyngbya sp. NK1-12]|uniref:Nitrate ABC transporter permease n=1 Tax=Leptolyngbya sp. NK1-12 TaxID=2547451 RepID=A0AA96WFR6_9CYAN|nr:nitrate ABC transporter permease [Leptolyngbya sp. NK1-12]WNZ25327.1 nitrate ABC transporter permease [Leptolyngbya sp. NK1-12]
MATNISTRPRSNPYAPSWGSKIIKALTNFVPTLVAIAVFLLIWQLLCSGPNATLPGPIQVLQDTWDPLIIDPFFQGDGTDQGLFWQLAASLKRVAIGYFLAAIVGIALGILVGVSTMMFRALDPIFQVLRTIPPLAWLPISLAAMRDAQPAAIFVIFITAIWPIIINTGVGVQNIPQDYNNVAKVLQLSKPKYFIKVLLPATVPYIFTGLKIAIGLSWLAIVAAEMLTGGVGIGFFIWDAYNSGAISEVILAILYVGLVGLLLDKLVTFIGKLVLPED